MAAIATKGEPMTRKTKVADALKSSSLILDPFGPAPILEGESSVAYDELLARISSEIKCADIFEEMWARDVVDYTWEMRRVRQMKANLISQQFQSCLQAILETLMRSGSSENQQSPSPAERLAKKWVAKDPAAIARVDKLFASANITKDTLITDAFLEVFETYESLDSLLASLEARRNSVRREIARHRSGFASKLKTLIQDVEEAEFETIEAKPASVKSKPRKIAT